MKLQPTKIPHLFVAWQMVPNLHGVLTIVIVHSAKEREEYRCQQCPKRYYLELLRRPDPELLVNQLLRLYIGGGEE